MICLGYFCVGEQIGIQWATTQYLWICVVQFSMQVHKRLQKNEDKFVLANMLLQSSAPFYNFYCFLCVPTDCKMRVRTFMVPSSYYIVLDSNSRATRIGVAGRLAMAFISIASCLYPGCCEYGEIVYMQLFRDCSIWPEACCEIV